MTNQRNIGLDLARAIAIISVIAAHTTGLQFGAFGVQLFFIISGYLLADYHLEFSSRNFLIHRYLRLAPLAIISTLVFYFRFTNMFEVILNILLIQAIFSTVNSFPGGWSISFEWLFSIVNIILIKLSIKLLVPFIFLIFLLQLTLSLITLKNAELITNPLVSLGANLGFFLSGHLIKRMNLICRKKHFRMLLFVLAPLFNPWPPYNLFLYNFSLVILFLFCLKCELSTKWTRSLIHFMGVRTYGIFLGHFIVMIGLQNFDFFINLQSNEGVLGQLLFFLMVVIGATGIGYVSYRFIEKPIILFSNKKFRFTS